MQDNVSIVITIIVLVILIVIFPLYNYFERQDNMTYNLVLKSTTNFVDDVLNKGYIDQDIYNKYISELAYTNNMYEVELEAHKKIITNDPDSKTGYLEQYKIDYNQDIFEDVDKTSNESASYEDLINKPMKLKNGIYTFNEGDQLYVRVKNANATMAESIFSTIVPTAKTHTMAINYGGIIKSNTWQSNLISNLMERDIYINIQLLGNKNGTYKLVNGKPTFYLSNIADRTIKYKVTVVNVDPNFKGDLTPILKANTALAGLEGNILPTRISKGTDINTWIVEYDIDKSNLGASYSKEAYVSIPAGIIQGKYTRNDITTTEKNKIVIVKSDADLINPNITGPFNTNGVQVSSVVAGENIYFYFNYYDYGVTATSEEIKSKFLQLISFNATNISIDNVSTSDAGRYKITLSGVNDGTNTQNNAYIKLKEGLAKLTDISGSISTPELISNSFKIIYKMDWEFAYTGAYQEFVVPITANYKFEVWGAQGGNSSGGLGGYAQGIKTLNQGDKIYIYVGGTTGWNGGGAGTNSNRLENYGGGASDVRTSIGNLSSRFIVAGGGGGNGSSNSVSKGGYGGGATGGTGGDQFGSPGTGGTQTSGGAGGNRGGQSGSLGLGGSASGSANSGGGGRRPEAYMEAEPVVMTNLIIMITMIQVVEAVLVI